MPNHDLDLIYSLYHTSQSLLIIFLDYKVSFLINVRFTFIII